MGTQLCHQYLLSGGDSACGHSYADTEDIIFFYVFPWSAVVFVLALCWGCHVFVLASPLTFYHAASVQI